LHQKERRPSPALASFQQALTLARELKDKLKEAETLREMAQVGV
jgi:exonuclease VII small subunit